MKILQMHNRYVYPGGEDAVARSEAALLTSFGHTVIPFGANNNEMNAFDLGRKISFYFRDAFFSKAVYSNLRRMIDHDQPDVAHAHNSFFMLGPAAYEACFDAGLPVVQTLHNYRFLCAAATFYRSGHVCRECVDAGPWRGILHGCWHNSSMATAYLTALIDTYKRRRILERMSAYIALSEFSRGQFVQGHINPAKIAVKPNFLEHDPGQEDVRGEYIVYAGAFQPYKGITTLLNAWKSRSWPLPLKAAGAGPLAAEALRQELAGVELLGQLPSERIIELIRGALCVVVPSECYENFPRVIIEAYACGIPVVASRLGALAELVQDNVTGMLFEPGNPRDLARCLDFLIQNRSRAAAMGQQGRRLFLERYSAQENYDQLMRIYSSV